MDLSHNNSFGLQTSQGAEGLDGVGGVHHSSLLVAASQVTPPAGDIILIPEKKKSKKWTIIGAVVAGLLVLISVVAIVFVAVMGKEDQPYADISAALLRYTNFVLYGDEVEDMLSENFSSNQSYTLDYKIKQKIYDQGTDKAYFRRLEAIFGDLYEAYNTSQSDEVKERYGEIIVVQNEQVMFLVAYGLSDAVISVDYLVEQFLENGQTAFAQRLSSAINYYNNTGSIGENYAGMIRSLGNSVLHNLIAYDSAGCIDGNSIDFQCVANIPQDDLVDVNMDENNFLIAYPLDIARLVEQNLFGFYEEGYDEK